MTGKAELEKCRKQFESWQITQLYATIMVKAFARDKTLIATKIREYILSEAPKSSVLVEKLLNDLERVSGNDYRSKEIQAVAVTTLEERLNDMSANSRVITPYLKGIITHASAHYTQIEIQEEMIELRKFIAELPKELLTENLDPAIKEVEDKIHAYRNADDKSGVVQKQNKKLIDDHALLIKLNKEAQAELESNKKSLGQQKGEKSALDKALPTLRKAESDLQASVERLTAEEAALKERIGTLKKQSDALQVDADTANRNKEKTLEQERINFVLGKFVQEIKEMKPKAQQIATLLHKELDDHVKKYLESDRTEPNKKEFMTSCRASVDRVMPQLNDLGLGKKIQNLLIALWNAITPQSLHSSFFKTDLANKAEGTLRDLENIRGIK